MRKSLSPATNCIVSALLGFSTLAGAEALPRGTPSVTITPAMIQESTKPANVLTSTAAPTRELDRIHENAYEPPRDADHIPNSCAHNPDALCFDYRTGSAVYKPLRSLLPELPGMTPNNISLRRNRIVAQYTFK